MLRLKSLPLQRLLPRQNVFTNSTRWQNTAAAETQVGDPKLSNQEEDKSFTLTTRGKPKIPNRLPLVKNFLLGVVDRELLAFPEVIPREEYFKLKDENLGITNYFEESFDPQANTNILSAELQTDIRNLGLYGLTVPQLHGGKGYHLTESLLTSEIENKSPALGAMLASHRVVVDVLKEIGTDSQKDKYLSDLSDGSMVATDAIFETNISQEDLFVSKAIYDVNEKVWILNGEKSFIVNGLGADLFLVITQSSQMTHENQTSSAIFLVEANTPGVTKGSELDTFGFKGSKNCSISFNNVKLSEENLLGGMDNNAKAGELFLKYSRIRTSLLGLEISKKAINHLAQFSISTKQCGLALKDMDNIKDRLSSLICSTYAMESMIYFTAGLVDEFDSQDVYLEAAVTKLYAINSVWKTVCTAMDFLGPNVLVAGEETEQFIRNAGQFYTQGEPIESLKVFISLCGLQHAGANINEVVYQSRNPLFHPMHIFKQYLKSSNVDKVETNMKLDEHVHPTLAGAAQCVEHSVARLQMCVELLLTRYGNEIVQKQVEIGRLTEIITTCFAMYASLSRASRSYCIGLKLADHELLTAISICLDGKERIKVLASEIRKGPYVTNDNNLQKLSNQIFRSKGYYSEHPITYNY